MNGCLQYTLLGISATRKEGEEGRKGGKDEGRKGVLTQGHPQMISAAIEALQEHMVSSLTNVYSIK